MAAYIGRECGWGRDRREEKKAQLLHWGWKETLSGRQVSGLHAQRDWRFEVGGRVGGMLSSRPVLVGYI